MKFTMDISPPDAYEVAFLKSKDLRSADSLDLTGNLSWSKVGLTHDDFVFEVGAFALDYVVNMIFACESLTTDQNVRITLQESDETLDFEKLPSGIRINDVDQSVIVPHETLVNAIRDFATQTIADLTREYPALGDNPWVAQLAERADQLRVSAG